METQPDPVAVLRHRWESLLAGGSTGDADQDTQTQQIHSLIPLRLFHRSRAGRLALLTLPPSGSPASQENLICYRWRALIDLGDDGMRTIASAPTRDAALEELALTDVQTRRAARQHLWRQGRRSDLTPAERSFVDAARRRMER